MAPAPKRGFLAFTGRKLCVVVLAVVVGLVVGYILRRKAVMDYADHYHWTRAQAEMAEIQGALTQHAHENGGQFPPDLSPLKDRYFPSGIPTDPFSKSNYTYQRTAEGFRLTCFGKDLAPGGADVPDRDIVYTETGLLDP